MAAVLSWIPIVASIIGCIIVVLVTVAEGAAGGPGTFVLRFTMPSRWTLATLPEPLDERVVLRALPGRRVAAWRYSGGLSVERYEEELARFRAALAREGLSTTGEPTWARYDPPWVPWFMRTNEIWLELK